MISFYYTYVFVLTHTLRVFEISLPVWSYWAILIKYSCQFNFLAMGSKQLSGNMVELSTFWTWGKKEVIGHKTLSLPNSKIMVNHIWCKVCAAHKNNIVNQLKRNAKQSAQAFIQGTNVVFKHLVWIFLFFFFVKQWNSKTALFQFETEVVS